MIHVLIPRGGRGRLSFQDKVTLIPLRLSNLFSFGRSSAAPDTVTGVHERETNKARVSRHPTLLFQTALEGCKYLRDATGHPDPINYFCKVSSLLSHLIVIVAC